MFHFSKFSYKGLQSKLGFTLLELLVSISIMTIIISVVVLNQSNYTEQAGLSNLADDIGLRVSQAQTYGISVKESTPGSADFTQAYGLSFDTANPTSYISFIDLNKNKAYDSGVTCPSSSECVEKTIIKRGDTIYRLYVITTTGEDPATRIDLTFSRPKSEASFYYVLQAGGTVFPIGARVVVRSPSGLVRSIIIYTTGHVAINNTAGPSCTGTYSCNQWDGNQIACTSNGHMCNWNSNLSRCNGGARQCSTLTKLQCTTTPNNCIWQ
jgi:prepilin-type N-terminal cleavage/methylation domain-containing protein